MWKPGTPKPLVLSHTTLPGKMPTGKKKLSVATMGMRFMQKRNFTLSGEVASSLSSKSNQKKDTEPKIYEESRVSFDRCTNSDMYGIQSDLIGRRSFGGFKKSVDDNWRACLRGGREDDNKNNSGNPEITDSELRRQYENFDADQIQLIALEGNENLNLAVLREIDQILSRDGNDLKF
eukprot:CAMPEP_0194139906 /NCGR_PEP_ID=MMETSP0152-20130528/9509_1 /TAXON_ID=1049557 /ORGANISM="Thalassiothrix antarctica, Strain L6-D1" /LENGTH=177 /DNA_ID=CAMNT_0038837917 /DNA_START=24 /DNA_END=558 /DNA_ORIENTATION=-